MRRLPLLLLAGSLACGLSGLPAAAQNSPPPAAAPGAAPSQQQAAQAFVQRFRAANTTHDGKLTRAQAEAANMTGIVRLFPQIDTQRKGYVTLRDIRDFRQRAQQNRPAGGGAPPPDVSDL